MIFEEKNQLLFLRCLYQEVQRGVSKTPNPFAKLTPFAQDFLKKLIDSAAALNPTVEVRQELDDMRKKLFPSLKALCCRYVISKGIFSQHPEINLPDEMKEQLGVNLP